MIGTLALLLAGHAVADTILQPPWLSRDKRSTVAAVRIGALGLHGLVHAAAVLAVTGSPLLAFAEWIVHPLIDNAKARGHFGMKTDQALHVVCKIAWALLA